MPSQTGGCYKDGASVYYATFSRRILEMIYKLMFRYREPGHFPEEQTQDEPIVVEEQEAALIPEVGDHVSCQYGGLPATFEVLKRHFVYYRNTCTVNIEVVGSSNGHKALNLKE
jgi:hypothetical protein